MLPKPSSCVGCPLYQSGMGFVPDLVREARVAILAQNPGANEEVGMRVVGYAGVRDPVLEPCTPQPLIGVTGYLLKTTYLPLAGLKEDEVSYHNVLKCRWNHSNELPKGVLYDDAVAHCTQAHLSFSPSCDIIVAHGAAAWAFTQGPDLKVSEWRGFVGPRQWDGRRVYATLHTADLLRDPHARFIARFDWKRLSKLLTHEWPSPVPLRVIAGPSTRDRFVHCLEEALEQPEIMVDTEYIPDEQLLTHVGAAWRTGNTVTGFQLEWVHGQATSVERAIFMEYWPKLCARVTMGFWNAKADLPILEHNLNAIPCQFEDPMQAHAVLWPDMDHDYGFVASIYGKYNKLKHLAKDDILLYHWGDMIDLIWIWEALKDEFAQDPLAEAKYRQQNLKLLPTLLETEARGIRVNHTRINDARPTYQCLINAASELAQAYCGFPINLGSSSQVCAYLQSEGLKATSIDKDVIAGMRAKYLPFEADREEQDGFSAEYVMNRVEQGAHPLLELRVMYATNNQVVSHYLDPLRDVARCHPQINIHTQAGGRHSTTAPPLATLPHDLRDIIVPDEGTVWIGWDWDQQEPRIQRAESGSQVLGRAFDEGEDIHTTFVCQLYGWACPQDRANPHTSHVDRGWREQHQWTGKDDPRRVFAKTTRYEINYGGDGSQAAKKAVKMGIEPAVAKRAAQVLLQSDPELTAWFRKVEREVESTHIIRSWDGGRRVFYWTDPSQKGSVAEMKRQARNFPPQGGGSGLYNLTIVEIAARVPQAKFVYGMHDSQYWQTQKLGWGMVYCQIKDIATQPRLINGMLVPFPASFKVMCEDGRVEKIG